jgi:hypothetical protein
MGQLLVATVRVGAPDGGRRQGRSQIVVGQIVVGERLVLRRSVRS